MFLLFFQSVASRIRGVSARAIHAPTFTAMARCAVAATAGVSSASATKCRTTHSATVGATSGAAARISTTATTAQA